MSDFEQLDRSLSVTREDVFRQPEEQGIWVWQIADPGAIQPPTPQLPRHGEHMRDYMLTATLDLEDMWASAINKAITKVASTGYTIIDSGNSDQRAGRARNLLMHFDGPAEFTTGIAQNLQDFLLTDKGSFIEIERVADSPNARVRALWHLDSFRCYLTGHIDYPVIYQDYNGALHKIPAYNVIRIIDMPSPRQRLFKLGRCAASRAFNTIIKLSAIETYFREKITGSRALALYFVTGVSTTQLRNALASSDEEKIRKGHVVYKGAVMVPIDTDRAINVATVDLAGVPDGFDVDLERRDAYLRYANAIGLPVQDIQPLSGQGLGTGTQTKILDEAAEGQGLAYYFKQLDHKLNALVLPKTTVFGWSANDTRDQQAKAELQKAQAATILSLLGTNAAPGVLTPQQALQMLVDAEIVPRQFIPEDTTPAQTVTDAGDLSKPVEEQQQEPVVPAQKDASGVSDEELDDGWNQAMEWTRQAQ